MALYLSDNTLSIGRFVKPFAGSEDKQFKQGGQFFTWDKKCRKAATEADKARSLSLADRENLVVVLESSDDEDEEEEEGMEMTLSDGQCNGLAF